MKALHTHTCTHTFTFCFWFLGALLQTGGGFLSSFIDTAWEDKNCGREFDPVKCAANGLVGAVTNVAFSQVGKAAKHFEEKGMKAVAKAVWKNFKGAQTTKAGKFLLQKAVRNLGESLFGTLAQTAGNKVFSIIINRTKELLK